MQLDFPLLLASLVECCSFINFSTSQLGKVSEFPEFL